MDSNCDFCNVCNKCVNAHMAWDKYKTQRNLTNKITKANKSENLVNDLKTKSAKNDLKGVWQSIQLATNLPTKGGSQPKVDKNLINATAMNQQFCEVGPKLKSTVPIYNTYCMN